MARMRVAVDTGGTFTDFVVLDEARGTFRTVKVPSTPSDPSEAVLEGMRRLAEGGVRGGDVAYFSHGTTVGTNALLELRGARTGLLITAGFRGVYEIGDQTRGGGPAAYDLLYEKPAMLAPPRLTEEVAERVDYQGQVLVPLDVDRARGSIRRLKAKGVESIAVCLLFSFMNPAHERRLRELIAEEHPGCGVSLSSEVLPQIREYPRLSTTVINAYLAPTLGRYLGNMAERLRGAGVSTRQLYVMQSSGGVTRFGEAAATAVATILSGPAAGVIAGAKLAGLCGLEKVVTLDMGGTSCDIALIENGKSLYTSQGKIGGRHVSVPMLDINTLSAGGGTIAWLDRVGQLKVGPQSAGAVPGPACYGRGGTEPTVTDANVALGFLDPDYFLGGAIPLDATRAERTIADRLAKPLGLSTPQAAEGVIRITDVRMEQGIKAVSSERGYDLREFVLIAFGGAGPVHAGRLAAALGIPRVLVPRLPGHTSALGLLLSDVTHHYVRSRLQLLPNARTEEVNRTLAEMDDRALKDMASEGFDPGQVALLHFLDLRYAGQGYELTVPLPGGALGEPELRRARSDFDEQHLRLSGHQAEAAPVELVNYRVVSVAAVPQLELETFPPGTAPPERALKAHRLVCWRSGEGYRPCPVYERERLEPGQAIAGPAIIEQPDSTVVVGPGQGASVDRFKNILIASLEGGRA